MCDSLIIFQVIPPGPPSCSLHGQTLGRGNRVCVLSAAHLDSHWYISPHPWDAQSSVYALYATYPLPRVLLTGTLHCTMCQITHYARSQAAHCIRRHANFILIRSTLSIICAMNLGHVTQKYDGKATVKCGASLSRSSRST